MSYFPYDGQHGTQCRKNNEFEYNLQIIEFCIKSEYISIANKKFKH